VKGASLIAEHARQQTVGSPLGPLCKTRSMSLENEVDLLIRDGQSKFGCSSSPETVCNRIWKYGYVEDIVRMSDVAEIRGYLDGLREAVMALARAIGETRAPQ
jgi:hypothetical protein